MFFEKKGELWLGRFGMLFGHPVVDHGFSTRRGGSSSGTYSSLNLGLHTDDDPGCVTENRNRFFSLFSASQEMAAIPEQVHGDEIRIVNKPGTYPDTDGLATREPGILLTVQVADCLSLFAYDPDHTAVAMVHAGWKGTEKKIAGKMVSIMEKNFGSHASALRIFMGPSIGPCCYEVGPDVAGRFPKQFVKNGRLDLWEANRKQLVDSGVPDKHVNISRLCTSCHSRWFYSHRRDNGITGRMTAVIGIRAASSSN